MTSRLLATVFLLPLCAVAQTQVPNVFEDGTPATAAEVNENFEVLSKKTRTYDLYSGDVLVGRVHPFSSEERIILFSEQGYFLYANQRWAGNDYLYEVFSGTARFFTEGDCGGQAYSDFLNAPYYDDRKGVVVGSKMTFELEFITFDETQVITGADVRSYKNASGCFVISSGYSPSNKLHPALPNNPTVTGFDFEVVRVGDDDVYIPATRFKLMP